MNRDGALVRRYKRGADDLEQRPAGWPTDCQVEDRLTSAPRKTLNETEGVQAER